MSKTIERALRDAFEKREQYRATLRAAHAQRAEAVKAESRARMLIEDERHATARKGRAA